MGLWGSKLSISPRPRDKQAAAEDLKSPAHRVCGSKSVSETNDSTNTLEDTQGKEDGIVYSPSCAAIATVEEDCSRTAVCEEHQGHAFKTPSKSVKTQVITRIITTTGILYSPTVGDNSLGQEDQELKMSSRDPRECLRKGKLTEDFYNMAMNSTKMLSSYRPPCESNCRTGEQAGRVDLGTGREMVGMRIKRQAGCTVQRGRIADYNSGLRLYKVIFDDGKEEVLEWFDLEPALLHDEHEVEETWANQVQVPRRYPKWRSINDLISADDKKPKQRLQNSNGEVVGSRKRACHNHHCSGSKPRKRKRLGR